jgi:predicted tellurium resistance membrane protein TerC
VAGAAKDHLEVLVVGLVISIVMMAFAANFIAKLIHKHRWVAWIGLLIIAYVAVDMIVRGMMQVAAAMS